MAFHTIVLPDTLAEYEYSRRIRDIVVNYSGRVTCDNFPNGNTYYAPFPNTGWCKRLSASQYGTGQALANAVGAELNAGRSRVLIDELNPTAPGRIDLIHDCAAALGAYSDYWNRWGVYVMRTGSLQVLQSMQKALDAVLAATAIVAIEMYVKYSTYCNNGTTTGARDIWLGNYFKQRMDYLVARREAVRYPNWPLSPIHPVFGVTDKPASEDIDFMNCANAAVYLDRMFYVWRTRSGHPITIDWEYGGVGSYKWQFGNLNVNTRDEAFRDSWMHSCYNKNATPRFGTQPGCSC